MFNFSKEDNIEKNDIMKLDKMNYPKYYLNLAIQQKQQSNQNNEIDKFVDGITKDYNTNYRYALCTLLKEAIIGGKDDKKVILNLLSNMYKDNEIQTVIGKSLLNRQFLGAFMNLDINERKTIIDSFVQDLSNKEFNTSFFFDYNEVDTNKINETYTFIKYDYDNENTRLIYIYEDGTIIGINVKNGNCDLLERKISKNKVNFIKKIISNTAPKEIEDGIMIIANKKCDIYKYESSVFYLVLMLINEDDKFDDKLFFKYDLYFDKEFKHELMYLNYEEKIKRFIFSNWCPAETERINIINVCRKITNNITIDLKECNLTDLKYFADYYRLIKDYNKAIIFYNELVTRGVELANLNLADCYDKIGNNVKYNECFCKAKDAIVPVFKKMTEKKCYKISIEKNSKPGILDSKINGTPYIPIGEEYPVNKDGKPMSLILQINFKDVDLEEYPQEGILEVFGDVTDIRNSKFKIRYYNDVSLEYQTELPKTEISHFYGLEESTKLKLEEHYTWMPRANRKFDATLKKVIKSYNKKANMMLYGNNEDDMESIYDLFNNDNPYPFLLGGYADYAIAELTSDGWECEDRKKESLIKLLDDETSCCLNIVISKTDLLNRKFDKAEVFYMD